MASKKQCFLKKDSTKQKNSPAQELQSPAPPLKRKGIFRRHSEWMVIVISKKMDRMLFHIFNEDYFQPTV